MFLVSTLSLFKGLRPHQRPGSEVRVLFHLIHTILDAVLPAVEGIQHLKMTNKSSVCAQRRRSRSAKPTSGALMEPLDSKEHRRSPCPSVTDSEDSAGSDLTTTSTSSGTVSPHHNDDPEYQHQHHHQQQLFQFARIFDEEEERVQIAASTGPAEGLLEYDEELDAEWMDLIT